MRRSIVSGTVLAFALMIATMSIAVAATVRSPMTPLRTSAPRLGAPVACPGCYEPTIRTSWQWQLRGNVDASFDVDMYDIDGFEASARLVDRLHARGSAVVCYISAGSWEDWRPDAGGFPRSVLGRPNGWPGERWLNVRRLAILAPLMKARLDMCAAKGFDAVELDNVDGYQNRTGFALSGADQLRFNVFLANQAHRRGLSAALKNDLGQIPRLLPYYDFALNEQCHQYRECGRLDGFVEAGKAVFGVEYRLERSEFCAKANAHRFNFLKKQLNLGAWRRPCRADA